MEDTLAITHAVFKREARAGAGARLCSQVLQGRVTARQRSRNAMRCRPWGAPAHDERKRDIQLPAEQLLLQDALQHAREDEAADDGKALADGAQALGDLANHDAAKRLRSGNQGRCARAS
jgi:hypothetical protein